MNYRLGIQMADGEPLVVMEELDGDGSLTGEVKKAKSLPVKGALHSNKENQLVLSTNEKEGKGDVVVGTSE